MRRRGAGEGRAAGTPERERGREGGVGEGHRRMWGWAVVTGIGALPQARGEEAKGRHHQRAMPRQGSKRERRRGKKEHTSTLIRTGIVGNFAEIFTLRAAKSTPIVVWRMNYEKADSWKQLGGSNSPWFGFSLFWKPKHLHS